MSTQPRRSLGGSAVEESLALVGFDAHRYSKSVSLVETHIGRVNAYVCQNAWNYISASQFLELQREYPLGHRIRPLARRALAQTNLRRSGIAIVLSEYMLGLMKANEPKTKMIPVTLPLDILTHVSRGNQLPEGTVLVPGSVTSYKAPEVALGLVPEFREMGYMAREVFFAGPSDGTDITQRLRRRANKLDTRFRNAVLTRVEMRDALETAELVVLPSKLESLGFSLAESLVFSEHVVARDLPSHRELSKRLGREPIWLSGTHLSNEGDPKCVDPGSPVWKDEWQFLASELSEATRSFKIES